MNAKAIGVVLMGSLLMGTTGCSTDPFQGIPESTVTQAKEMYTTRCATCHGPTGRGNGPGAANLTPKPRTFVDADWQKATSDEDIEKVIVLGGAAVGKSPAMAANPDLASKPELVKGLRAVVRSFAK